MTIVTKGTDEVLEQIEKQLNKLVDVVNVTDLNSSDYLELELAIIKVRTSALTRVAIVQLVELFHGYIPNVNKDELCIAISGSPQKIEHFLTLMSDFKIIEIARTGSTATRNVGRATTPSRATSAVSPSRAANPPDLRRKFQDVPIILCIDYNHPPHLLLHFLLQ